MDVSAKPKPNGAVKPKQAASLSISQSKADPAGRAAIGISKSSEDAETAVVNSEVVSRAAGLSDKKAGRAANRRIHELAHDAQHLGEAEAIKASVGMLREEAEKLSVQIERSAKECAATPDWRVEADLSAPGIPFSRWRLQHKIELPLVLLGLIAAFAAFAAGGYTAYVNLYGSGLAVFIENPLAAVAIATIVPVTSLVFKSFSAQFTSERGKRNYRRFIGLSTIAAALFWMAGVAEKYSGLETGFDFEAPDPSVFADGFVLSQLLLEVLIGAGLALSAERIFLLYAPTRETPEQRKAWLEDKIKALKIQRAEILDAIAAKQGRLAELGVGRTLQGDVADLFYQHRCAELGEWR